MHVLNILWVVFGIGLMLVLNLKFKINSMVALLVVTEALAEEPPGAEVSAVLAVVAMPEELLRQMQKFLPNWKRSPFRKFPNSRIWIR